MIKKLSLLIITIALLLSTPKLVMADVVGSCGSEWLCPAPVGECVTGGPWEVGEYLITQTDPVCRCSRSNELCSIAGSMCHAYSDYDENAPTDDRCRCYDGEPFCDSTWWTKCCSPGDLNGTTPTPIDGEGGGGGGGEVPVTTYNISGKIQQDIDAGVSGSYCSQSTDSPLILTGLNLSLLNSVSPSTVYPVLTMNSNYVFNTTTTGNTFTVTLDLSGQVDTNYVCSCPAPLDPISSKLLQSLA